MIPLLKFITAGIFLGIFKQGKMMNTSKTQLLSQTTIKKAVSFSVLACAVIVLTTNPAFADLSGGLGKAESTMTTLKDWGIRLAGIGAVLYILWKALETWRSRGDWGDFAISACYVAIAGASPAIANWAWTAFQ